MLTGQLLGDAIRAAIVKKGVKPADVARHFGIKPPSVQGWMNTGRISKPHFEKLRQYFADTVTPDHWGLIENNYGHGGSESRVIHTEQNIVEYFLQLAPKRRQALLKTLEAADLNAIADLEEFDDPPPKSPPGRRKSPAKAGA